MPKGVYPRTEKHKQNWFQKGHKSWLGRHHTEESKRKISQNKSRAENLSQALKGRKLSEEHKRNLSLTSRGENNWNWIDGRSYEPYPATWTETLKESIRQRDDYQCQLCGKAQGDELKEYKQKLSVHHKDENKKNLDPKNLITLCKKCHAKLHFTLVAPEPTINREDRRLATRNEGGLQW